MNIRCSVGQQEMKMMGVMSACPERAVFGVAEDF